MYNLLYTEALKLRSSKILWLIPAGGIIPVVLNFINKIDNPILLNSTTWQEFIGGCQLMISELIPSLIFLLAGFVFTREYHDNTIYTLFTYPITRLKIMVSKTLILLPLLFSLNLLACISSVTLGLVFIHGQITWALLCVQLRVYLIMFIVQFALVPAAITLGIISRSIIASATGGICCILALVSFLNSKFNVYFPWCVPALITNKIAIYTQFWDIDLTTAWRTLIIAFLIPLIFNMVYYSKSDA